jgi:hypothetical protein
MRIVRYAGETGPRWGVLGDDDKLYAAEGELWRDLRPGPVVGALDEARLLASSAIRFPRNHSSS